MISLPCCLLAVVIDFSVLNAMNDATVAAVWNPVDSSYISHYTVYYKLGKAQTETSKSQITEEELTVVFPAGSSSGVIGELEEGENYLFSITVSYNISGELYEGNRSDYREPSTGRGSIRVFVFFNVLVTMINFFISAPTASLCVSVSPSMSSTSQTSAIGVKIAMLAPFFLSACFNIVLVIFIWRMRKKTPPK